MSDSQDSNTEGADMSSEQGTRDGRGAAFAEARATFGPSAILTPANAVTLARILASPVAFLLLYRTATSSSWPLAALWFVLSTTDLIDGILARKYGTTRSGAFLDPLADKILVLGGIGILCWTGRFPVIALALISVRELAVSWFRSRFATRGLAVPASKLAKWKAFLQLAAVGWVTLPPTNEAEWLADSTLWIGVVLGLISGAQYFVAGQRAATSMAR